MKTLDQLAIEFGADKSSPYHGYTTYYESLFEAWRNAPIRLLEIGVQFGASIRMWLAYFDKAHILGVDCVFADTRLADVIVNPRFTFILKDQGNRGEMTQVAQEHGRFEVIIDDGSHRASDMRTSFECLWPALKSGGVYIIEDLHALYHPFFASAVNGEAWLGGFIGDVNRHGKKFHGRPDPLPEPVAFTDYERAIESVTFTRGLAIFRKR